jgi:hypothetical protein
VLGLTELLLPRGLAADLGRVKLVRHRDSRIDVEALQAAGWLEVYQAYQAKPVFHSCDQIVVFIGEGKGRSRFIGVFGVGVAEAANQRPLPPDCPDPEWANVILNTPEGVPVGHFYPLTRLVGFEDLENRVVVDWGLAPLAWHQRYTDREVIEVRARGRILPPFRDYLRVHLSHADLVRLASHADAHRDWVAALSAVGGVYLIVEGLTGRQYVGSATGLGGIWQRWCEYARTGHGDNRALRELCDQDARCPAAFSLSILETFSRTTSRDAALALESFFKRKLGSRAFGLNTN